MFLFYNAIDIDTVIFILVALIFIAFILNLFSIISAKQQLAGEVNSTTDSLFPIELTASGAGISEEYWK